MTDPQLKRYHKSIDGVAAADGAWCLFSDVSALLIAQAAQVEQCREAFRHLEMYVKGNFVAGTTREVAPAAGHAYLLLKRALSNVTDTD